MTICRYLRRLMIIWQQAGFPISAVGLCHGNLKLCQTFVSFIDFHVFYFICELLLLLKAFCRTKCFAKVTKSCRYFEAKKCKTNIPFFSKLCYLQKRNFVNLPLNSLTPNFVVSFVFWGTAFSVNWSISNSETSTNLAAILKTVKSQCYNPRSVIIAGRSDAPSQS